MSFSKKLMSLSAATALILCTGCASIVSESQYAVAINSTPDNANFVVTNSSGIKVQQGTTPSTVTLNAGAGYFKKARYTITVSKEGYADTQYTLVSSVDGWYWGNILFGGIIGMLIVDPNTGAMYKLPGNINIGLNQQVANTDKQSLIIATLDSLNAEQKAQLIKVN